MEKGWVARADPHRRHLETRREEGVPHLEMRREEGVTDSVVQAIGSAARAWKHILGIRHRG